MQFEFLIEVSSIYYVNKEMIEGGQMLMFADMVGGWGRQNADVSKKKDKKGKRKKIYILIYCCNKNHETKKYSTQCMYNVHVISIKTYFKIMMS